MGKMHGILSIMKHAMVDSQNPIEILLGNSRPLINSTGWFKKDFQKWYPYQLNSVNSKKNVT